LNSHVEVVPKHGIILEFRREGMFKKQIMFALACASLMSAATTGLTAVQPVLVARGSHPAGKGTPRGGKQGRPHDPPKPIEKA
jgi:hypothetical protein